MTGRSPAPSRILAARTSHCASCWLPRRSSTWIRWPVHRSSRSRRSPGLIADDLVGAQVRQPRPFEIAPLARSETGALALQEDLDGGPPVLKGEVAEEPSLEEELALRDQTSPELVGHPVAQGSEEARLGDGTVAGELGAGDEAAEGGPRALALGLGVGARRRGARGEAALLVLPPAAAGTGVVPADPAHRRASLPESIGGAGLDDVAAEAEGGRAADMGPLAEDEVGPEGRQVALVHGGADEPLPLHPPVLRAEYLAQRVQRVSSRARRTAPAASMRPRKSTSSGPLSWKRASADSRPRSRRKRSWKSGRRAKAPPCLSRVWVANVTRTGPSGTGQGRAIGQREGRLARPDEVLVGRVDDLARPRQRVNGLEAAEGDAPPAAADAVHLAERDDEVREILAGAADQREVEGHGAPRRVLLGARRGRRDHEGPRDLLVGPQRLGIGRRRRLEDQMIGA